MLYDDDAAAVYRSDASFFIATEQKYAFKFKKERDEAYKLCIPCRDCGWMVIFFFIDYFFAIS